MTYIYYLPKVCVYEVQEVYLKAKWVPTDHKL